MTFDPAYEEIEIQLETQTLQSDSLYLNTSFFPPDLLFL